MQHNKRGDVSHKARRLVERSIRLHVDKATRVFQPTAFQGITLAESNAARDALARRARMSKQSLFEYLSLLEADNKRMKHDLRMWDTVSP